MNCFIVALVDSNDPAKAINRVGEFLAIILRQYFMYVHIDHCASVVDVKFWCICRLKRKELSVTVSDMLHCRYGSKEKVLRVEGSGQTVVMFKQNGNQLSLLWPHFMNQVTNGVH